MLTGGRPDCQHFAEWGNITESLLTGGGGGGSLELDGRQELLR